MVTDYGSRATLDFELVASLFTAVRDVEALQYCERALAQEPTFEGLKLLGQIAERGDDRRRARTAWRQALATDADPGQHRSCGLFSVVSNPPRPRIDGN